MRLRHSLAVANLALMMLGVAACSGAPQTQTAAGAAGSGKIAPVLLSAVQQLQGGANLESNGPVRSDAKGRIQIYVHVTNTSSETVTVLTSDGLQDTEVSPEMNIVQGWIAPSDLVNLAALPFVTRITPPQYARPR